ncbi:hypothetical protein D9757_001371 [Collybiopsis confluens]|uniref:UBX domain-containing protein n=1 Tax=Collybiopsis confluens TaxID=2823264 RepID=A0A8H5MFR2_9AGAR|nr:hypothetical protein D9757_001371 [Collybiopsis confluens]
MSLNEFKVYKPFSGQSTPQPDLPDDYFEPTAADLKLAQTQLNARTQALNNAPLQLRATREASEKTKRDRWPNTRIRIKFTDGTQLEKVFPSTDKIKSIYAFVRNSLREDVKPIKFILYQPPQRDLKVSDTTVKNLSLAELQLAPSSILLLRFEDESLNGSNIPAPLADSVWALAESLPAPPPPPPEVNQSSSANKVNNVIQAAAGDKKVPKWLKLGKK